MTCHTCGDRGIVRLNFQEGDEYCLCLCPEGEAMRRASNGTVPLWHLWCAREQVDPGRVHRIEDVLTPAELAERGFAELTPATAVNAIAAAARARRKP